MFRISVPEEDYLKAIYTLDPMGAGARIADIAKALAVTRAGALRAVAQLERKGLAERFGKGRAGLTEAGRRQARNVRSRYEVIRLYYVEILQVDFRTAAREATRLEHILSDASFAVMKTAVETNDDWGELAQLVCA